MLASPPPGTLHLIQGQPNRNGAADATVYLLRGDATAGPVLRIIPADGAQAPPGRLPLARPVRIKLLHFNDLHGHIAGLAAGQDPAPVFSRIAAGLRAARVRCAADPQAAVLAVTGGDESGGVIFDELLGHDAATYQLHAGYRLYAEAGVDLGVLGNHDLDRGAEVLAQAICRDAAFPILAANVAGSPALAGCCYPAAIFVLRGVRVGFIGLVTPAETHPEPGSARRITDPVEAAHQPRSGHAVDVRRAHHPQPPGLQPEPAQRCRGDRGGCGAGQEPARPARCT